MKNFRARVTFPVGAANEGVGYVWLCRDRVNDDANAIGGIYGCYRGADEFDADAIEPEDRVGVLKWIHVAYDGRHECTASFSGADDDGLMSTAVTVTPHGQPPYATKSIRSLAGDLAIMKIYNFHDGEALISEIEVEYESEDESEDDESA